MCYSPRKRPEMPEITSFFMIPQKSCDEVPDHLNPRWTAKPCAIAHENGQKCPKSRVFTMPIESCTGGHGALKSSGDPKTLDYSPRKRPDKPQIASFYDATRVVYRGSRGFEIFPGPKNCGRGPGPFKSTSNPKTVCYSPRKRLEMPKVASFYDATRVVYRG